VKVNCTAALLFSLLIAGSCLAHVGSPDVYFQGDAGPYRLVVAILTPQMIPGVAEIQIRSSAPGVQRIKIVPVYIMGEGSKYPPPPDVLTPSKGDPQFFSGKLWLMASGSWEVRIEAEGDKGSGTIAVPVPAAARNTLPMEKGLGAMLLGLMALLVAAIVSIVGAARREGQLEPGVPTGFVQKRGARIVMAIAFFCSRWHFDAWRLLVEIGGGQSFESNDLQTATANSVAASRREDEPPNRRVRMAHPAP
jgi:hypothetical protein